MATMKEKILQVVKEHPGWSQNRVLEKAGLHVFGAPRITLHRLARDGVLRIERINKSLSKVWPV